MNRRDFATGAGAMLSSGMLARPSLAATGAASDFTGGLQVSREYMLDKMPAAEVRDAVNVWLEENSGAFGMRVGVEATSPRWDAHELWLDIAFPRGRVISLRTAGKAHPVTGPAGLPTVRGAGPVRFECVTPFRQWTVSFKGRAPEITAAELIKSPAVEEKVFRDVEFDIEMIMAAPPWVPGSLLPEAGLALNGSDQGEFMSPRYEQLLRATGVLRIDGEVHRFLASGLRVRRQGVRKYDGFWGHCWQSALFPSGKGFGYNAYPPRSDGRLTYNEGYVFDGKGSLKPARAIQIPWMTSLLTSGDAVPLVLQTVDGLVSIDGRSFINTRSRGGLVPRPGFPIVQQSHARYVWDGEVAYGMMERSTVPEKMNL